MLKTRRERLISLLTRSLLGHYSFPNTRRDRKLRIRSFAVFCRRRAAYTDDVPDCHLVKASSPQPLLLGRRAGRSLALGGKLTFMCWFWLWSHSMLAEFDN